LRRLFNWSVGTNEYGIKESPVSTLRPSDLIGKKEARARILSDDEIRSVWGACEEMGHPYGPLIRMLILTAQREREVSDMVWSEIDFDKALWTIPARRMKMDSAHLVPLAPETLALLKSMPRIGEEFVFTTNGAKAVNGFSKAKARIDKLSGVTDWKFHDLRRTARTSFSALPVQDVVRELAIAHAQPGLRKVYDLHLYQDEKRELFTLWEQRLKGILAPKPPADVADIEAERARRAGA
jgi:integrase